jgi:hypothetical protein
MDERNQVLPGFTVSGFAFSVVEDFREAVGLRGNRGGEGRVIVRGVAGFAA